MSERTLEIMVGGRVSVEIGTVAEVRLQELLGVGGLVQSGRLPTVPQTNFMF